MLGTLTLRWLEAWAGLLENVVGVLTLGILRPRKLTGYVEAKQRQQHQRWVIQRAKQLMKEAHGITTP